MFTFYKIHSKKKISSGNGWAAAGMLRVLGTIQQSPYSKQMKNQQKDLASWIGEIHDGMYDVLVSRKSYSI